MMYKCIFDNTLKIIGSSQLYVSKCVVQNMYISWPDIIYTGQKPDKKTLWYILYRIRNIIIFLKDKYFLILNVIFIITHWVNESPKRGMIVTSWFNTLHIKNVSRLPCVWKVFLLSTFFRINVSVNYEQCLSRILFKG